MTIGRKHQCKLYLQGIAKKVSLCPYGVCSSQKRETTTATNRHLCFTQVRFSSIPPSSLFTAVSKLVLGCMRSSVSPSSLYSLYDAPECVRACVKCICGFAGCVSPIPSPKPPSSALLASSPCPTLLSTSARSSPSARVVGKIGRPASVPVVPLLVGGYSSPASRGTRGEKGF